MQTLSSSQVKHVAKLSRLELTDEEVSRFGEQLSSIISYINELESVDTSNVEPTSQTTGLENVTRNDEIIAEDILPVENAVSGTEHAHNNYFVVPLTLGERTV